MTLTEVIERFPVYVVNKSDDFSEVRISHVVAGDLMSDVLVGEYDELLIVSSLASEQTLRTADIVGARAILLVNDKVPQPAMKELAKDENITLLATPLSMFEACIALGQLLGYGLPAEKEVLR